MDYFEEFYRQVLRENNLSDKELSRLRDAFYAGGIKVFHEITKAKTPEELRAILEHLKSFSIGMIQRAEKTKVVTEDKEVKVVTLREDSSTIH